MLKFLKVFLVTFVLVFLLVSCGAKTSTPAPPNSPQTQVLNVTKTLADAINGAVHSAVTLNAQGTVSDADVRTINTWAKSATAIDDSMATELGSSDSWTIQKQKLLLSLAGFKLPVVTSNQTLQSALQAVMTLVQQIQQQVSQ